MSTNDPLVSVVTPVYNGEPYIAECISSVLGQTYTNWEYIIVNNRSTDRTLELAESFAMRDPRVRIHNNATFVGVIENHNIALSLVSPESKYVKIVAADDWLYSECISRLVDFANRHPSVGIVGSYSISNTGINSLGISYDRSVFRPLDICRPYLLGEIEFFATPLAVLYRSELIRTRHPFFPDSEVYADAAAALTSLQSCDFGFVHQILSFQRWHPDAISHRNQILNGFVADKLDLLAKYGSAYLTQSEQRLREAQLLDEYYKILAAELLNFRNMPFWGFHKRRLGRLGYSLCSWRLIRALLIKIADVIFNPKLTIDKLIERMRRTRNPYETLDRRFSLGDNSRKVKR